MSRKWVKKEHQKIEAKLAEILLECDSVLLRVTEKISSLKHEAEAAARSMLLVSEPNKYLVVARDGQSAFTRIEAALAKMGGLEDNESSEVESEEENEPASAPVPMQESGFPPPIPVSAVRYGMDISPLRPSSSAFQPTSKPTSPVKPTPIRSRSAQLHSPLVQQQQPHYQPQQQYQQQQQQQQQQPNQPGPVVQSTLDPGARPFQRPGRSVTPVVVPQPQFQPPPEPTNQFHQYQNQLLVEQAQPVQQQQAQPVQQQQAQPVPQQQAQPVLQLQALHVQQQQQYQTQPVQQHQAQSVLQQRQYQAQPDQPNQAQSVQPSQPYQPQPQPNQQLEGETYYEPPRLTEVQPDEPRVVNLPIMDQVRRDSDPLQSSGNSSGSGSKSSLTSLSVTAPEFTPSSQDTVRTSYASLRKESLPRSPTKPAREPMRSPRQVGQAFSKPVVSDSSSYEVSVPTEPILDGNYLKAGQWVRVMVMEMNSPVDIQIRPMESSAAMEDQAMRMAGYYMRKDIPRLTTLPVDLGYYAAQFAVDNSWYRAITTGNVHHPDSGELEDVEVGVTYIDFGNAEFVTVNNMRDLPRKFRILPKQAYCIALNMVGPVTQVGPDEEKWSTEVCEFLKQFENVEMEARYSCGLGQGTQEWIFADLRMLDSPVTLSQQLVERGWCRKMANVDVRVMVDAKWEPTETPALHDHLDMVEDTTYQAASFLALDGESLTSGSPVTVVASGDHRTGNTGNTGIQSQQTKWRRPDSDSTTSNEPLNSTVSSLDQGSRETLDTSESVRYSQDSLERPPFVSSQVQSPARFPHRDAVTVNQLNDLTAFTSSVPGHVSGDQPSGRVHDLLSQEREHSPHLSAGPLPELGARATNAAHIDLSALRVSSSTSSNHSRRSSSIVEPDLIQLPDTTQYDQDTPGGKVDDSLSEPCVTPEHWDETGSGTSVITKDHSLDPARTVSLVLGADIPNLKSRSVVAVGGKINFMLAHVNSLDDFYIHLCDEKTADDLKTLSDDLKVAYDEHKTNISVMMTHFYADFTVDENSLVCARWCTEMGGDGGYYRAMTKSKRQKLLAGDKMVEQFLVFFVDYGNCVWVGTDNIHPLGPSFREYPAQAIKCSLAHVTLAPLPVVAETGLGFDESHWSEKVLLAFENICGEFSQMLTGYLYNRLEGDNVKEPLNLVILNEKAEPEPVWVNVALVKLGLACINTDDLSQTTGEEESCLIEDWNPMMAAYLSQMNTYHVDVNDPEIFLKGYDAKPEEQVCQYFNTQAGCYRGTSCPYRHSNPEEKADTLRRTVVCPKDSESIRSPELNAWVVLKVTVLVDPGRFFAYLPHGSKGIPRDIPPNSRMSDVEQYLVDDGYSSPIVEETLEQLQESLNEYYTPLCQEGRDRDFVDLAPCEIVAARSKNQVWYRAKVLEADEDEIHVFYVDFGNSEKVLEESVRQIEPQFLHLPFQAVECMLANVRPASSDGKWSRAAKERFRSLTEGRVLFAHVVGRTGPGRMEVDLYNTETEEDIHINMALMTAGFAQRLDSRQIDNTPPTDNSFIPG